MRHGRNDHHITCWTNSYLIPTQVFCWLLFEEIRETQHMIFLSRVICTVGGKSAPAMQQATLGRIFCRSVCAVSCTFGSSHPFWIYSTPNLFSDYLRSTTEKVMEKSPGLQSFLRHWTAQMTPQPSLFDFRASIRVFVGCSVVSNCPTEFYSFLEF